MKFLPGRNIAVKVPAYEYEKTVGFYKDTLGFKEITTPAESSTPSTRFAFGEMTLWIDRMETLSQSEIWLEVLTDNTAQASDFLQERGCVRRDEIEPLPEGFQGFWISAPGNLVHLVTGHR